jgi:hypothetical protein
MQIKRRNTRRKHGTNHCKRINECRVVGSSVRWRSKSNQLTPQAQKLMALHFLPPAAYDGQTLELALLPVMA